MRTLTHTIATGMLRGWFSPRSTPARTILVLAGLILAACAWAGPVDVSPAQKDQLKALASDMREKTMRVRRELMAARMDLFQVYRVYDLDDRKARALIDKIGKSQSALLNLHLDNQIALRRILNEPQFNEFCRRMKRFGGHMMGLLGPHEEGFPDKVPDKDTLEAIGATPDQGRRIWRTTDAQEKKTVVEKLTRDSKQIGELYSRYDLDVAAARKLIDSIHQSQMDLAAANHKSQQTLRSVLTQQQFDRLQEEISKRVKRHDHKRPFHRF